MEELNPCPVCGGEATLISISYDRRYFAVCDKCGYKHLECWDEAEAIKKWNQRNKNDKSTV